MKRYKKKSTIYIFLMYSCTINNCDDNNCKHNYHTDNYCISILDKLLHQLFFNFDSDKEFSITFRIF